MHPIPSVLVIDDNYSALKALTSLMTALGAETVCEAESAEQALEMVEQQQFDLIVSDYRLEGMNGVEFLEQVRAKGNQTPVLLLSGAPDKAGSFAQRSSQRRIFHKTIQNRRAYGGCG